MIIIKNNSNGELLGFNLDIKLNGRIVSKLTEKDYPISDNIEINLSTISALQSVSKVDIELKLNYKNNKHHVVNSANFNIRLFKVEVTTYGSSHKLKINSSINKSHVPTEKEAEIESNLKFIQLLVDEYMKDISDSLKDIDMSEYVKKEDFDANIIVVNPDDYGAVGNGVANDDKAFLEGNYIYNLPKDRVYKISKNKLSKIENNRVIGDGVIKCEVPNSYTSDPTKANGNDVYYIQEKQPSNRLLECVEHRTTAHTYNTNKGNTAFFNGKGFERFRKQQTAIHPHDRKGHFHNIGAVYHDYDHVADIPDTFTLCIGRSVVWVKKKGASQWIKKIDCLPPIDSIQNYRLPWGATSTRPNDEARPFTESAHIVDNDHIELVVHKNELTSWLGTDPDGTGGIVHFWSNNYFYTAEEANEYDDYVSYWELWVKEKEAAKYLQFSLGIDTTNSGENYDGKAITSSDSRYFFYQSIVASQLPISTQKQAYWGTSMNIDEARNIDYDDLVRQLTIGTIATQTKGYSRTTNLLCPKSFSKTVDGYTLSYDENTEEFTLAVNLAEGQTAKETLIDITSYLRRLPPLKTGDTVRVMTQYLDGTSTSNQGNFWYGVDHNRNLSQINNSTRNGKLIYKTFDVVEDMNNLYYKTRPITEPYSARFKVWFVKGGTVGANDSKSYESPYQNEVRLNSSVVDTYLEDKISNIEDVVSNLDLSMSKDDMLAILRGEQ